MNQCPRCGSRRIHRVHRNRLARLILNKITARRPHRCNACGWSGWAEATSRLGRGRLPDQVADVNLEGLDDLTRQRDSTPDTPEPDSQSKARPHRSR